MQWCWLSQEIPYTGRELRSGWIADIAGLEGDAIVAFVGPCEVPLEHMVDMEDVRRGVPIAAAQMLHFLAEHFDTDLARTVLRQRLLVCLAAEILNQTTMRQIRRDGDDLFVEDRKLSVSVATGSPTSTLIHLGVNIDPSSAPVPAVGLDELSISAPEIAKQIMAAYIEEMQSCQTAHNKVRRVP